MNEEKIVDKLNDNIKKANTRLRSMRASGYGNLSVIKIAMQQAKLAGGVKKGAKTFSYTGQLDNYKKMMLLNETLEKFLASPWTTKKGRAEILQKRMSTFTAPLSVAVSTNKKYYGLTEKEVITLFDIFETDAYHKLVEKGIWDSKQQIDFIQNHFDVSADFMEKIFNEILSDNDDKVLMNLLDKIKKSES